MINVTMGVNGDKAIQQMLNLSDPKQLPFILSKAINSVAKDVQAEVKKNMPQRFQLRNNWSVQGIQVKFSSKTSLEATVFSRDDYMRLQESGGDKTPLGRYLAVPTVAVRRTPKDKIRKSDRPKALGSKAHVVDFKGDKWLALKSGKYHDSQRAKGKLRLMYLLIPRADIKPRLKLREDGDRVVRAMFPQRLQEAIDYAMRTARPQS